MMIRWIVREDWWCIQSAWVIREYGSRMSNPRKLHVSEYGINISQDSRKVWEMTLKTNANNLFCHACEKIILFLIVSHCCKMIMLYLLPDKPALYLGDGRFHESRHRVKEA